MTQKNRKEWKIPGHTSLFKHESRYSQCKNLKNVSNFCITERFFSDKNFFRLRISAKKVPPLDLKYTNGQQISLKSYNDIKIVVQEKFKNNDKFIKSVTSCPITVHKLWTRIKLQRNWKQLKTRKIKCCYIFCIWFFRSPSLSPEAIQ